MAANQSAHSLNRSVIKFLMVEEYKPHEIYRRMCDVYGEACFSKKKEFTNELNIGLLLSAWVKKTVHPCRRNTLTYQ